jgi:hypothetical protein
MRHKYFFSFGVALALLILSGGFAVEVRAVEYVCNNSNFVRRVEVRYLDAAGAAPCEVHYHKDVEGGTSVLWNAKRESGYCEKMANAFVDKLRGMGWSCNEKR